MKTKIVQIGNSQGVRIPKVMLTDSLLVEDVELEICDEGILIKPARNPRQNWDTAFQKMAEEDGDELVIEEGEAPTGFEREGWRW